MKLRVCTLCLTASLILAGLSRTIVATPYVFTNIADDSGPLDIILGDPSINALGTVAITAYLDGGSPTQNVLTGNGGPTTTVADSTGPFSSVRTISINDSGTLALVADLDGGGQGIFTRSGGPFIPVADDSGAFRFFNPPTINASGTVVFDAFLDSGIEGIFTGNGGPTTTIADTSGPYDALGSSLGVPPAFNAANTVAFFAHFDTGGAAILSRSGGLTTTIADDGGPFANFIGLAINAGGTVAFDALLDDGSNGIFTGNGGAVLPIVDNTGPFREFGNVAINASGTVAFDAALDAGGAGIFTGDDPIADKVITLGDPLFGSTVTELLFFRGLNDSGQITFHYVLADGVKGVAVAHPVSQPVLGDYNNNGVVDAGDYVIWRKSSANYGGASGYNTWRAAYGEPSSSRSGAASLPEPSTICLAFIGILFCSEMCAKTSRLIDQGRFN